MDTTKQVIPATGEVPDATDSLNNEFERVKRVGSGSSESTTCSKSQSPVMREDLQRKRKEEQTTLECAKENPERSWHEGEPRSDRVSRLGIVAVISRFAVLWMTRAKWKCLDDIN